MTHDQERSSSAQPEPKRIKSDTDNVQKAGASQEPSCSTQSGPKRKIRSKSDSGLGDDIWSETEEVEPFFESVLNRQHHVKNKEKKRSRKSSWKERAQVAKREQRERMRTIMEDRIVVLPLPSVLKRYLNLNRQFIKKPDV